MGQLNRCACGNRKKLDAKRCMDCRFGRRSRKETATYVCAMVIPVRGIGLIHLGRKL